MEKTYKSSSWEKTFSGTRTQAIKGALEYLKTFPVLNGRYTWRAEDESGFTIQAFFGQATLAFKWNAARK